MSVVLNCDKTFKVLRTIEDKLIKELMPNSIKSKIYLLSFILQILELLNLILKNGLGKE